MTFKNTSILAIKEYMKPLRISIPIVLLISLHSFPAFASNNSPEDVVKLWNQTYGIHQDKAAEITTLSFREGKEKKQWAQETYRMLKEIEFRYLKNNIIKKQIDNNSAIFTLQSLITTIAGKTLQKEYYYLIKDNEKWLINDIAVGEEVIIEERSKTDRGLFL